MSFENYVTENKLGVTAEQKAAIKALSAELVALGKKLKATFKYLPINVDTKYMVIKVGFDSFSTNGVPSLRVQAASYYHAGAKKELEINQSSTEFTRDSLKKYSAALSEISTHYDLLNEVLNEAAVIHKKYVAAMH